MDICESDQGQCLCKENVSGLRCDRCSVGATLTRNTTTSLECEGCGCNPIGSVSLNCDSITGLCACKTGVTGLRCDQCLPGFMGLSVAGCSECSCDPDGSDGNTCNPVSGECPCLSNVVGARCDSCAPGFYNISAGCVACDCNTDGTVNGSVSCDFNTGQCNCKSSVQGRACDTCNSGFTTLEGSNPDGCAACDCFTPGTNTTGIVCDPLTSQCDCFPSAEGPRCDICRDGFRMIPSGCELCACDPAGSNSTVCDKSSGNCLCQSEGITGRTCDTCLPGFFQFPRSVVFKESMEMDFIFFFLLRFFPTAVSLVVVM